jgi:glycosyltransferase involved in cell wall biosynthesis
MKPEISVVILCYQAGERIRSFVDKAIKLLDSSAPSWEIILVANYLNNSNDITPQVVKEISARNQNVKSVARVKEGMMGWDARSGLREAAGRYICLIDGDEQMPPEDIISVYRKIADEGLDFVTTYRLTRCDGVMRKFISSVYNLVFKLLFPEINIRDVNSKPKIFKAEAYAKMRLVSDDWFIDAEMVIQAKKLKLKMGEVPTEFFKCKYRKSFVKIDAIFEFMKNLLKARFGRFF